MDDEERVQLIVEAVAQGFAAVGEEISGLGTQTEKAAAATQTATMGFTELRSAVLLAQMGFQAIKGTYEETITPVLDLSDQIRKLQRDIGASAEESSKLIYAGNQVGVSADVMSKALDQAINRLRSHHDLGIEPNVQGLEILADRYLAIQDPIKRTQFLLDEFGKAGANMAPLMMLGSDGIQKLGDQAQATGMVMGKQAVDAAYQYEQSTKTLNAAILGLKVSIAEGLFPTLQGIVTQVTGNVEAFRLLNEGLHNGTISLGEYVGWLVKLKGGFGDSAAEVPGLTKLVEAQTSALGDLNIKLQLGQGQLSQWTDAQKAARLAIQPDPQPDVALAYKSGQTGNPFQGLTGGALDLAMAQAQLADATAKAADAQAKLNENQVPGKFDALRAAADNAAIAVDKSADALRKLEDVPATEELKAGMAGKLAAAETNYGNVVETNAPKIKKLQDELAKYEALQGKTITTTTNAKVSAEDYQVAQERQALAVEHAQLAEEKYQAALAGTIDKHGKLHQASALTIEGLRQSAEAAAIAVEASANSIQDMSTKLGTTSTYVADYSTKIADLQGQIDPLVDAENKARDAISRTTAAMLDQAIVSDPALKDNVDLQLQVARGLGLISDKDYNLMSAEEALIKQYKDNIAAHMDASNAATILTYQTVQLKDATVAAALAVPVYTSTIVTARDRLRDANSAAGDLRGTLDTSTTVYGTAGSTLDGLSGHVQTARDRLRDANSAAGDLGLSIDALHDKTINVNVIYRISGGGNPGGGDVFTPPTGPTTPPVIPPIVPPIITPPPHPRINPGNYAPSTSAPGGGSGDTVIINDKLAAALYLESRRQATLARHEALM